MEKSTVIVQDAPPRASSAAVLTLQRGASTWASWTFDQSDAGTSITVGADSGCAWQVAAPGVPPLEIRFTGRALLARSVRPSRDLRHNHVPLTWGWTRLEHGDRLDLGPARIDVTLARELADSGDIQDAASQDSGPVARELSLVPTKPDRAGMATIAECLSALAVAELRVRQGSSRWNAWSFGAADAGMTITLGAAPECDWQLVAAGVEPLEVMLLFAGDAMLVKSARPQGGARLDGVRLSEEWTFMRDGARLDMGMACVEVRFTAARSEGPAPEPDSQVRDRAGLATSVEHVPLAELVRPTEFVAAPTLDARNPVIAIPLRRMGSQAAKSQPAVPTTGGNVQTTPTPKPDADLTAFLFSDSEDEPARSTARPWTYLALGVALSAAYLAWIQLLDRL